MVERNKNYIVHRILNTNVANQIIIGKKIETKRMEELKLNGEGINEQILMD